MSKELIEQLANPVFGNHPAGCGRRIIGFILDEEVAETLPFGDVSAAFNKLLEAYAQTQGQSNWQPIESAPQDGTKILGFNDLYGARETYWRFYGEGSQAKDIFDKGEGPSGNWNWSEPQNSWASSWKPTHWMPLPASWHKELNFYPEGKYQNIPLFTHAQPVDELVKAAQAVVDRWETPLWKDAPATAGFIYKLRDEVAKHRKEG